MSSVYVRTQIKSFIDTNLSSENVIDESDIFQELHELLADNGLVEDAPWLGLEFFGGDELPIGLAATNVQGKYRESGSIQFNFYAIAKIGVGSSILTRGEALRDLLRGQRIGDILIESLTPMNLNRGELDFEGGYMSGFFLASYIRDLDL